MAFEIVIGQYHPGRSLIHRLDPRIKLTLLLALTFAIFLADGFIGLGVLSLFLLICIALSAIPARLVFKALAPMAVLLMLPLILNIFLIHSGTILVSLGPITLTTGGLYQGGFVMLRLLLLLVSATLVTLTTSPIAFCDAIAAMLAPLERFGLPAYEVSMMISIALRFIPTLAEDFDRIRKAQRSRGAVFNVGGPIRRLKAIIPCLVPLFSQSFQQAEDLAQAMESRCYHAGGQRTHYHELRYARRDAIASLLAAALLAAMIIWL